MFDIKKILKRSWVILWSYRILWVFGFLLAVGGNQVRDEVRYTFDNNDRRTPPASYQAPDGWRELRGDTPTEKIQDAFRLMRTGLEDLQQQHPVEFQMGIAVAITFIVVALLFAILAAILRYVAETSTIRMVDEYEQSGVKVGFRQGWKYGWSRSAWRVFLVNFIVHLPVLALFVVLGLLGWWIFSALMGGVESTIISSLIAGSGLAFLLIFVTVIVMVVLYVVRDFAWRLVVLEGAPTLAALRMAWALVRRQWKNAGLMWLVMVGLKIAWAIAFIILLVPLLIVSAFTALGGLLVATLPTLATAGIASLLSAPEYWPWAFAAVIGLPFFLVVAFSPVLLVAGWAQIYQSSVWTLTYRELKVLEAVTPEGVAPEAAQS